MRPQGTAASLEARRRLAVHLLGVGMEPGEVGEAVGATGRSVRRWRAADRGDPADGLAAVPQPGRPAKLSVAQAAEVLSWVGCPPGDFGFQTDRWTAPRVAEVLRRRLGVRMHPRYLNDWLRRRGGVTPQVPQRRAAERDEAAIAAWVRYRWPRIKKTRGTPGRRWRSPTRRGSCCCRSSARRWPRAATRRS